jgi:hypothetical protein
VSTAPTRVDTLFAEVTSDPRGIGYAPILASAAAKAEEAGALHVVVPRVVVPEPEPGADAPAPVIVTEPSRLTGDARAAAIATVRAQLVGIALNSVHPGAQPIRDAELPVRVIKSCYVPAEVIPILPTLGASLDAVAHDGVIPIGDDAAWAMLEHLFAACPQTLAAIDAAARITPSRAQELFGARGYVTYDEVEVALAAIPIVDVVDTSDAEPA